MKTRMRITKHNFSVPAVTVGAKHYFPSNDCMHTMPDGTITIAVCYYSHTRRKWLSDVAYLSLSHAQEIIDYAIKRGVLTAQPDLTELEV